MGTSGDGADAFDLERRAKCDIGYGPAGERGTRGRLSTVGDAELPLVALAIRRPVRRLKSDEVGNVRLQVDPTSAAPPLKHR